DVYEEWNHVYPRDTIPLDNLALNYAAAGLLEKALSAASEAKRLDPKDQYAPQHLANVYVDLNRYDEARRVAEQAAAQKLDSAGIHIAFLRLALIRGDQSAMQREVSWATGRADEPIILEIKAAGENALGRVGMARETAQLAIASANRQGMQG